MGALLAVLSALLILWRAGLPASPQFLVQSQEGEWLVAPLEGGLIPSFQATTLTQTPIEVGPPLDGPLILNFWATWCEPCLREMPLLEQAAAQGIEVIGINAGLESPAEVTTWVESFGVSYPIVVDDSQRTLEALYRVRGLPTTFFIDQRGIIRQVTRGELTPTALWEGLAAIEPSQ
jgi:cytochrome c biogenesis protein CcmG/thiol:disulfide interchange protein DsbE